ncbi:septin interacting protein 1 [Planoprotostelium fungivorum]|uniref:Septin interacting protein 1 n=1 Tax=Planoprotostelium fungivorum TaxID=1890364 RepID=A0A2P6NU02_9EUKA|nr:septin interacting protein 1 [Planoprotostelium fungivorum]
MYWGDIIGDNKVADILDQHFFPKWLHLLYVWLLTSDNFAEISRAVSTPVEPAVKVAAERQMWPSLNPSNTTQRQTLTENPFRGGTSQSTDEKLASFYFEPFPSTKPTVFYFSTGGGQEQPKMFQLVRHSRRDKHKKV